MPGDGRVSVLVDRVRPTGWRADVPHPARIYDYLLCGKDNFPADRKVAEQALAVFPTLRLAAQANRAFLGRATRFLAAEAGIRQFLDVGAGLPRGPNLHEVAQQIAPDARVVYVDNDPMVLVHARALLASSRRGRVVCLEADLREPETILGAAELRDTVDLTRPVALSLGAVLQLIPDKADPYRLLAALVDALPAGSYLTLTHLTADLAPQESGQLVEVCRQWGIPTSPRSRAEVERFVAGLQLVDPGVVVAHRWRPGNAGQDGPADRDVSVYAAVARKP